jgi:hypothetical protein
MLVCVWVRNSSSFGVYMAFLARVGAQLRRSLTELPRILVFADKAWQGRNLFAKQRLAVQNHLAFTI